MTEAKYLNYVNGKWSMPEKRQFFTRNSPIQGTPVSQVPQSSLEDVRNAIDAAHESFEASVWSGKSVYEKSKVLLRIADTIEENAKNIAEMETLENGKIFSNSIGELFKAADYFRYYAGALRTFFGKWLEPANDFRCIVTRDPVGVCSLIVPWNSPIDLLSRKLAPALAAGCSVVVKPSSLTPGTTFAFWKVISEINLIPAGVVNVVTGSGSEIGDEMVTNKKVKKIAFTGSTQVGENIMMKASKGMKRVSLELGGKSPNIIFSDAKLDKAVPAAFWALFRNAGQSCSAGSRLLVEDKVHDKFVEKLTEISSKAKIGNPFEENTDYGPIVSEQQFEKVMSYVNTGNSEELINVRGGQRLVTDELKNGLYIEPTIFDKVPENSALFQDEIFGPVLTVSEFQSEDEAVEIANSTKYGLEAGIWTNDMNRALRVAKRVECGNISINNYQLRFIEVPFGGVKSSGMGRELGLEGLEEYMESKTISIDLSDAYLRQKR